MEARTEAERLAALPQTVDRLLGSKRRAESRFFTFQSPNKQSSAYRRGCGVRRFVVRSLLQCSAAAVFRFRLFPNLCDRLLVTKNLWLPGELMCIRYCLSRGPSLNAAGSNGGNARPIYCISISWLTSHKPSWGISLAHL